MPKISIIISTYNRARLLKKCLNSLENQTLNRHDYEIIVVDNNSVDSTKKTVESFLLTKDLNISYLFESKPGISSARNTGANHAKAAVLGFIDDDAVADAGWLKQALELLKSYQIFGGPIFPYYRDVKPVWFLDKYEIRSHGDQSKILTNEQFLSGSNIFIEKKQFFEIGGFDDNYGMKPKSRRFGEETVFQKRAQEAGCKVFYSPDLKVDHLVPAYKMNLSYIAKTHFTHGLQSNSLEFLNIIDVTKILIKSFVSVIKIIFLMCFGVLVRNRKEYKYWQQYFWQVISPNFFWLGKFSKLFQ